MNRKYSSMNVLNLSEDSGDNHSEISRYKSPTRAVTFDDMRAARKLGSQLRKNERNARKAEEDVKKNLLRNKFEELQKKYFSNSKESYDIVSSILDANTNKQDYAIVRLQWEDFSGWDKFIPYKNAHPENCVNIFLSESQKRNYVQIKKGPLLDPTLTWSLENELSSKIKSKKSFSKVLIIRWPDIDSVESSPSNSKHTSPNISPSSSVRDLEELEFSP